ncbi:MAG: DUF192 domain-containing protein [Chloroflexi bacterium]|nr:DUF192 domain-containing protein [Chloroflexota bacterium]
MSDNDKALGVRGRLKGRLEELDARQGAVSWAIPELEVALRHRQPWDGLQARLSELTDRQDILYETILRLERLLGISAPSPLPRVAPEPARLPVAVGVPAAPAATAMKVRTRAGGVIIAPLPPHEPEKRRRFSLRESVFSRRRLRGLIILAALLVMMLGFGAAWYFNGAYQQQRFARRTVSRMANAPSYAATGYEDNTEAGVVKNVKEQFAYVSPDSVMTRYFTRAYRSGTNIAISIDCGDEEIRIVNGTRYQICNDPDAKVKGWRVDTFPNPSYFDTLLFQPWARFAWCGSISEQAESEVVNGASTRVFSCRVPNRREAATIWEQVKDAKVKADRDKFIEEAIVDITIWVREDDGYIGRFGMKKTAPGKVGSVTETTSYEYFEFGNVPPIPPPDTSGPVVTEAPVFTTAVVNGQRFNLLVADTEAEISRGMAGRPFLPADTAMLFVLPKEEVWEFWMKDVFIPLDLLFVSKDKKIVAIHTMPTELGVMQNSLKRYNSKDPALYALEMNAGLAKQYGFQVGMNVELR